MQVKRAEARNFASYKELAFDFTEDRGLILIQGPTGSGKSTFCDLVPWVLFGRTAKGGGVDEIRSWNSKEPTTGTVLLDLPDGEWEVIRQRGKTNDLAFRRTGTPDFSRGKDLTDTQRLLNEKLGLDFDLYLAGGYYHEFSQTAAFFTTTAKNRRLICEQLVDLSLATKLKEAAKLQEKELNNDLRDLSNNRIRLSESLRALSEAERREQNRATDWERDHSQRLIQCARNFETFEQQRIRTISKRCPTCKTMLESPHTHHDISENPYGIRLAEIESEKNPFSSEVKSYKKEIEEKKQELKILENKEKEVKEKLFDLEELQSVVDIFRSTAIYNTIRTIEARTVRLLSDFFDGELRVSFEIQAADKVEVIILKDGNEASFTQLSKGQRQMLKLCFGVAVMEAVQNHHGITLSHVFFDESLDGLDDSTKLKAVRMLDTITQSYQAVFVVEHSETVKAMVSQKYSVELVNGESQFAKAE